MYRRGEERRGEASVVIGSCCSCMLAESRQREVGVLLWLESVSSGRTSAVGTCRPTYMHRYMHRRGEERFRCMSAESRQREDLVGVPLLLESVSSLSRANIFGGGCRQLKIIARLSVLWRRYTEALGVALSLSQSEGTRYYGGGRCLVNVASLALSVHYATRCCSTLPFRFEAAC